MKMYQENRQKFISSNTITFKMNLTSEQHNIFKEWSDRIPTLYMLDICVVSATKLTNASLEKQPRKIRLVTHLRELDRPANCFSYLFALMEKVSDSRGRDTPEELERKILSDLSAMRDFFQKARVYESNDFVIEFLKELRGNPIEIKRTDYLEFLNTLNNQFKLYNPVGSKQRLTTAKEIIGKADFFAISRQHPIVSIGLACLYGNPAAKKLMKFKADPKKFDSENALSDIMMISRFAGIKLEIEEMGRNGVGYIRSDFITDDNGLIDIIKCFKPSVVEHTNMDDGRETKLTMTVSLINLLTEIETTEYDRIIGLLKSN